MRIVYFGSSEFSVPPLKSILPSVSCIVTRKTKPKGRGYQVETGEIGKIALEAAIPLIELDSFKDEAAGLIAGYNPDLFVVASFGLIIPKWALDMPVIGPVNVHPSLLPKYRGPSPIQWALWNGEPETGITFMKMNEKMDQGDILYQETVPVNPEDDAVTLSERLAFRTGEILPGFIVDLEGKGMGPAIPQDHEQATYTPIITKEMGLIDWSLGALEITRQVRALASWPVAYTYLEKKSLKIFTARIFDADASGEAGAVMDVTKEGLVVATPNGILLVKEVQIENKKRMSAYQFAQGQRGLTGKKLG